MSTVKPGLDTDSVPGLRVASEALASLGAAADRHVIARAMRIALWTWPAFAALDAYMCFVAYPAAPFSRVLTYRIVVELFYVGEIGRAHV